MTRPNHRIEPPPAGARGIVRVAAELGVAPAAAHACAMRRKTEDQREA
jgi:hypothetical protein